MPPMEQPQISDALRRFNQLASLSEQQLDQVAEQVRVLDAARGTCLLDVVAGEAIGYIGICTLAVNLHYYYLLTSIWFLPVDHCDRPHTPAAGTMKPVTILQQAGSPYETPPLMGILPSRLLVLAAIGRRSRPLVPTWPLPNTDSSGRAAQITADLMDWAIAPSGRGGVIWPAGVQTPAQVADRGARAAGHLYSCGEPSARY